MDFDRRLRACVRRWHLQAGGQLAGGFRSVVVRCAAADGTQVVLKLVVTRQEMRAEAAALTAWAGTGAAARLIDTDFDHGALLLEQVRPGTHLLGNDDPGAIEVAASLLGALHRAPLPAFPFPASQQTFTRMERRARRDAAYEQRTRNEPERGRPGLQRLPLARAAASRLCASPPRTVLLHGDFLAKNLLSNGTGYVAIDPIPGIGDPCADVGFFAAGHPPRSHDPAQSRCHRRADGPGSAPGAMLGRGVVRPAGMPSLARRPIGPGRRPVHCRIRPPDPRMTPAGARDLTGHSAQDATAGHMRRYRSYR